MNRSAICTTPESSPGLRANASRSSAGWPPYRWIGGTSPRSVRLVGSTEYFSASSPIVLGRRVLPGQLPDLLGPPLVVEHDHAALGPRAERRREGLVEILLRHRPPCPRASSGPPSAGRCPRGSAASESSARGSRGRARRRCRSSRRACGSPSGRRRGRSPRRCRPGPPVCCARSRACWSSVRVMRISSTSPPCRSRHDVADGRRAGSAAR